MTRITDDMLTPWFAPDQAPVREGVYETTKFDTGGYKFYALWAENEWKCDAHSIAEAAGAGFRSPFQNRRWRGLRESALEYPEHDGA